MYAVKSKVFIKDLALKCVIPAYLLLSMFRNIDKNEAANYTIYQDGDLL